MSRHPITLLIDSNDRKSGNPAYDFDITLPTTYYAKRLELLHSSIPLTEYTISGANNQIPFVSFVAGSYEATIANGFYDSSTFPAAVKAAMDSIIPAAAVTFTVTFSALTGKLSITPSIGQLQLTFGSIPTNIAAAAMGFSPVDTGIVNTAVSDLLVDLSPPRYLYLDISSVRSDVTGSDNTLATFLLPTGVNSSEIQQFNALTNFCQYARVVQLQTLHIRLKKKGNNSYNNNNVNWCFALRLFED